MKKNLWLLLGLALVATVVAWFYFNKSSKTYQDTDMDFSVSDTASIDKIVIADTDGKKVVLKRQQGEDWSLNDSMLARPELTQLILRVFKDVIVQSKVASSAKAFTIKRLASIHKRVEIYQDGNSTPTKIWYVGDPTQSHFGTNVLLETPGDGKAEDPYIVEVPWHKGFITPMFQADQAEWMQTRVFVYPELNFKKIKVTHFEEPDKSFEIDLTDGKYAVKDVKNNRFISSYDTLMVKDYIVGFRKIYYEARDKYLTPFQADSMRQSTPLYKIAVTENDGKVNEITIYRKFEQHRDTDEGYVPNKYDRNRMYANYKGNMVLIQNYNFDKLFLSLQNLQGTAPLVRPTTN